jgi:hypothetical protein
MEPASGVGNGCGKKVSGDDTMTHGWPVYQLEFLICGSLKLFFCDIHHGQAWRKLLDLSGRNARQERPVDPERETR